MGARDALKLVRRMWPHRSARGMRARPEWALLGYHGRVLVSTRGQELEAPPLWGQAQIKAGSAAQGIGSLGTREGGGSCCMMEFVRRHGSEHRPVWHSGK